MCDNCRAIFSENDPGWQRGTVRNLATIGGETVVQEQSEDRCPDCAVGAVAQGNAVRIYQPEVPRSLRGMDPRIQSALGAIASMSEGDRQTIADLARGMGTDVSQPAPPPTPVLPADVKPVDVPPRLVAGNVEPVQLEEETDGDHRPE